MNHKTNKNLLIVICCVIFLFSGCLGSKFMQRRAINIISPMLPDLVNSMMKQRSLGVARDGMAGTILLINSLSELNPGNREFLVATAIAYTGYALMIEDENESYAIELYSIAKDLGIKALKTNGKFKEAYDKGGIEAAKDTIDKLGKEYVPALIWTSVSWGMWMLKSISRDAMALQHLHIVQMMADKSNKLNDKYFNGLSHLLLMVVAANMPPMMGGSKEVIEEEYKKVMTISNNSFLLAKYYFAKFYTVNFGLEDKFDEAVKEIMGTSGAAYPDIALLNEIAKAKAKRMNDNKNELFP